MNRYQKGLLAGVGFGAAVALPMLKMDFEDKRAAILGAFANRAAIGFVIATSDIPLTGWQKGALLGALLSLPDAIITKAWAPIMAGGTVGGAVIGKLVGGQP